MTTSNDVAIDDAIERLTQALDQQYFTEAGDLVVPSDPVLDVLAYLSEVRGWYQQ